MEKYSQIKLHVKNDIIKEIEDILSYRQVRDLLSEKESSYVSVEDFMVGCVCYYLRQLKTADDIADIRELGKPFQLKNRIEKVLERKGWTQKDLVEKTGIPAGNINNIVKNKNQPSLDNFMKIWIALNCPPLTQVLYRDEDSPDK